MKRTLRCHGCHKLAVPGDYYQAHPDRQGLGSRLLCAECLFQASVADYWWKIALKHTHSPEGGSYGMGAQQPTAQAATP